MKWPSKDKSNKGQYKAAKKIITDSIAKNKEEKKKNKMQLKQQQLDLKQKVKELKDSIKNIKLDYKQSKKEIPKDNKDIYQEQLSKLKEDTYIKLEEKKEEIYNLKYEFGKKHNTLWWNLKKWAYGVGKEFRRIIWSPPLLTIKYLGIVILIIGFLSAIFTAILKITELL